MKKMKNRFTALLTSVLGGIALLSSVQGAPLPIRENGIYTFKEGEKTVTWRVVPNQVFRAETSSAAAAFVDISGSTVTSLANSVLALDKSLKRRHSIVIKKDGDSQPHILSKKVFAVLKGTFSTATVRTQIGAATVYVAPGVEKGYIFTFAGPAAALSGAETLLTMPNVASAIPLLGSRKNDPDVVINDPYYADRASNAGYCWHLENTGGRGALFDMDINAKAAWDRGLTGSGLKLSVVDDGLETAHPDLRANVLASSGYDFVQNDLDPTAGEHGTCVGGLMAGVNNSIGGLGGSYRSRLIGLRVLGAGTTDEDFARAIFWSPTIAISNHSYGPTFPGYEPLDALRAGAINEASARGRGARGTIMVCSAGNKRGREDGNQRPYGNNYFAMPVSATNDKGDNCSYTTWGASNMVGAPSGDTAPFYQNITTTDRSGVFGYNPSANNYSNLAYTNGFDGTSAAAPIIAGAVGLMLQAKPLLSMRDVNDIIARTAKPYGADPTDPVRGFQTKASDGILYHFCHDSGAGVMDVDRATTMARTWRNLTVDYAKVYVDEDVVSIPDGDPNGVVKTIRVPTSPRIRCEKVEIDVTVNHPDGASLDIRLVSALAPAGTISLLQRPAPDDRVRPGTWHYTTTQHWAECIGGEWRIEVVDRAGGDAGQLGKVTIKFHGGSATRPTVPPFITDADMPGGVEYCQRYRGYRIVASNCPLSYAATGLPVGLKCDYLTGEISGTPYESGTFTVVLSAKNEAGVGTLTKTLLVLPRIPAPKIIGGYFAVGAVGEPLRLQVQSNVTPKEFSFQGDADPGTTLIWTGSGLIVSYPVLPGIYEYTVTVENYCGRDSAKILLYIQPENRTIADALDVPGTSFNLDWNDLLLSPTLTSVDTWFWGDDESVFGGDSVVSPIFGYRNTAEMYTTVDGPVRVEFDWKANSHPGDIVEFYTQAAPSPVVRQISGNVGWRHEVVALGAGTHTLRWVYNNATAAHSDIDRARVDHLQLIYTALDVAVDGGTSGSVNSFGAAPWEPGAPAGIQSPILFDAESSSVEVAFTGPGTLKFDWKVSSQLDQDILSFFLNGSSVPSVLPISGEVAWTTVTLNIPSGTHRARWTYAKDEPDVGAPSTAGSDTGYVDNILFTPAP